MHYPDPITVHELLTSSEIADRVRRNYGRSAWVAVLVRQVEAETLRRAARLTRELEVLLPYSGTVRESVAVALESRAGAADQVASLISTDSVLRRTTPLRRVS
jgi:hypothetical protein